MKSMILALEICFIVCSIIIVVFWFKYPKNYYFPILLTVFAILSTGSELLRRSLMKENDNIQVSYDESYLLAIFYNEQSKCIEMPKLFSEYSHGYFHLFSNLEPKDYCLLTEDSVANENDIKQLGADLIERLIFIKFIQSNLNHWDYKTDSLSSPNGNIITKSNNDSESIKLKVNKLRSEFEHNHILTRNYFSIEFPYFHLPENSLFEIKSENSIRQIEVKVPNHGVLRIGFYALSSGPLHSKLENTLENSENIISLEYKLNISFEFEKDVMKELRFKNWYDNILKEYKELDWSNYNNN